MRVKLGLATFALALTTASSAPAHVPSGARGGEPIARSAATQAEMIATRTRYFGAENVDPRTGLVRRDRVILSWVGVMNYAMAIRGHVVLLDAWVPRGAHSGYVPSSPEELAKLRPSAIFIGHAHFDHAADAVPIALASGATIVGSAEQCDVFRSRAPAMPPRCLEALPAGAAPGARAEFSALRGVETTIVKHVHSAGRAPDGSDGYHVPVAPPPSTTQLENPPTPQDMAHLVERAPDSEAGTVLYRFRLGDLSLVWHDSAGPLADDAPAALDTLRALRPVDVQVGAIQGFNQVSNGMRDPRMYVEALSPRIFVPGHHDDWAAGITTKGEAYRAPLDEELARIPPERRPQVRFLTDPADYVRPELLTFPVRFDGPRLTRRCTGAGRLRVRLTGDTTDVKAVAFGIGRRRPVIDSMTPFQHTFTRESVALRGRRPLTAEVTGVFGDVSTLRRNVPSCGVRARRR